MNLVELCNSASNYWFDPKVLLSTFLGALLAFVANFFMQMMQRRWINLAAGNRALATVSKMYGDFVILRAGVRGDVNSRQNFPVWAQVNPSIFQLSDSLRFDLGSLAFLAANKQQEILSQLILAETAYQELRNLLAKSTEACEIRDQRIAAAELVNFALGDIHQAQNAVGEALVAKLAGFNEGLISRAHTSVDSYRSAGNALYKFMNEKYGKSRVMPFSALGARDDLAGQDWSA